jgi:ubiquitin carboxyl-terminal hydrolase L3
MDTPGDITATLGSSAWLPLESNPEMFDAFGKRVGLPDDWGFFDVLGLDDELLEMIPKPCAAFILLFPCIPEVMARRPAPPPEAGDPSLVNEMYFLSQHAAAGNACGTFAALHAIINSRHAFALERGPLDRLLKSGMSADERGRMLLTMTELREQSDAAAEDRSAQTACPSRDGPDLDHHFVALVCSANGRLVELDGTLPRPVDHGAVSFENFTSKAARVVKERFLPANPSEAGSIEFALCALSRKPQTAAAD